MLFQVTVCLNHQDMCLSAVPVLWPANVQTLYFIQMISHSGLYIYVLKQNTLIVLCIVDLIKVARRDMEREKETEVQTCPIVSVNNRCRTYYRTEDR